MKLNFPPARLKPDDSMRRTSWLQSVLDAS
jgi:hypothetical protein